MFFFACGFACPAYDIQFSPFWIIIIGELTFNNLSRFRKLNCLLNMVLFSWSISHRCCSTWSLWVPDPSSSVFSSEIDMFEVSLGPLGRVLGSIIDSLSEELWYFSGWDTRQQGCTLTYVPPCLTRTCLCSYPMTVPGPSHLSQRFLIKDNDIQILFHVLKWLAIEFPAIIGEDRSWSPKICYPVFEYSIDDVRTFFTRNPDSDTVSSSMVSQVKYFVAIDFFDIHGNIFVKIWS